MRRLQRGAGLLALALPLLGASPPPPRWEDVRPSPPLRLEQIDALLTPRPPPLESVDAPARFRLAQGALVLAATIADVSAALQKLPRDALAGHPAAGRLAKNPRTGGEQAFALRGLAAELEEEFRERLQPGERRAVAAIGRGLLLEGVPEGRDKQWTFELVSANDTLIDSALGIRYRKVEASLPHGAKGEKRYGHAETYIDWNLPDDALQTSYLDLERIFESIGPRPGQRLVDLGSGYGRIGFWLGLTRPGVEFIGYELVAERVAESRRVLGFLGAPGVSFEEKDLVAKDFAPAAADFYFAYDPVSGSTREKLLADLRAVAARRRVILIAVEGQGSFLAALAKEKWLSKKAELPCTRPVPFPIVLFEAGPVPDGGAP